VGCVGCVGGVEVWALWGCGVTPYVRHSPDCTCCDFGHLRFYSLTYGHNTRSVNFNFLFGQLTSIIGITPLAIDDIVRHHLALNATLWKNKKRFRWKNVITLFLSYPSRKYIYYLLLLKSKPGLRDTVHFLVAHDSAIIQGRLVTGRGVAWKANRVCLFVCLFAWV
jgi:hypothetical protein